MVQGLLKSFFLHTIVIGIFIYGAEIFKKNKRFEINEIPFEIVDVSDQTVNKIENKKKEKVKKKIIKNQSGFQPPKVKLKPTPPEFKEKTEKVKDKKSNKEEKKIAQEQKKRVDSILKSIEKIKTAQKNKEIDKEKTVTQDDQLEEKEIKNIKLGEKLTISEKDAIRRQFYQCWIVPAGAKNIKDYKVSIKLKLNKDGEVINSKIIDKFDMNNTFFRTLAESAIRAVNHPDCKKLKVPAKKYETWKETILDFDPSVMIN